MAQKNSPKPSKTSFFIAWFPSERNQMLNVRGHQRGSVGGRAAVRVGSSHSETTPRELNPNAAEVSMAATARRWHCSVFVLESPRHDLVGSRTFRGKIELLVLLGSMALGTGFDLHPLFAVDIADVSLGVQPVQPLHRQILRRKGDDRRKA